MHFPWPLVALAISTLLGAVFAWRKRRVIFPTLPPVKAPPPEFSDALQKARKALDDAAADRATLRDLLERRNAESAADAESGTKIASPVEANAGGSNWTEGGANPTEGDGGRGSKAP